MSILIAAAHAPARAATAADHPALVRLDATECTACHGDLVEGRSAVHVPAEEDCASCHEVSISETGTRVSLLEEEPGLCLVCHDDLTAAVDADLATPHYPVTDSCLTCHDPHAGVVPPLLIAPVHELCGSCHDPADLDASHGGRLPDGTACARCHQPHGSDTEWMLAANTLHRPFGDGSCDACHRPAFGGRVRLTARGEKLCTACHGDLVLSGDDGVGVHAALYGEKGRAGCLSCHDPHMGERMLLHATGPDLCASCHGAIVLGARAETGHAIAADDCLNCHLPHASEHGRLLAVPADELCGECHDTADAELVGAHLGADLASLECTNCHSPHGDGHPKLLAANLHSPVADGCELCHDGAADRFVADPISEVCLVCHEDIGEIADAAAVAHPAMEVTECTDCHNPHASRRPRLLLGAPGEECTACHDEQAAGVGEVAHGVIDLVGCHACHEPHGGNNTKMLRQTGSELCLACHDARVQAGRDDGPTALLLNRFAVPVERLEALVGLRLTPDGQRNHPVMNHRVRGRPTEQELARTDTNFEGEFECLTCHDPHKGRSKGLLRWNATSSMEACLQCHPK
ncbi:MAG: cytochrome c3 family protein [Acidobacteriota bacterium]